VAARPGAIERDPEQTELLDRIRSAEAGEEEQQRLQELRLERSRRVLEMEPADVYAAEHFVGTPPPKARIQATLMCDRCGEGVMETRIRHHDGQQLCVPCHEAATEDG
jgi:formylmethanofuran dehydrogenase subunit E